MIRRKLCRIRITSGVNTDQLCQDDEDDDADRACNTCLVCGEFGRDNEIWYRCTSCGLWAHAECTGWNSARNYVCDMTVLIAIVHMWITIVNQCRQW